MTVHLPQLPQRDESSGKLLHYRGAPESRDCATCPSAVSGRPRAPVKAFGAVGTMAVIGEGPSTEEVQQGYPFVGPSGREMNRIFQKYGMDRYALWISNALVCPRPQGDDRLFKAVQCCRPRLEDELKTIAPRVILALGKTAMISLKLDTQTMADARGTVQNTPLLPGVPVITTMHPAALLRGGAGEATSGGSQKQNVDAQMMFLEADVLKAYRIMTGELPSDWSDDIMVVVEPPPQEPEPAEPSAEIVAPPGIRTDQMAVVEDPNALMPTFVQSPVIEIDLQQVEAEVDQIIEQVHAEAGVSIPPELRPPSPDLAKLRPEAEQIASEIAAPPPVSDVEAREAAKGFITMAPCEHKNVEEKAVGFVCKDCGMRAPKEIDGTPGVWFDPEAATEADQEIENALVSTLREAFEAINDKALFIRAVKRVVGGDQETPF